MATTLEVEVMYSALDNNTGKFERKRVGLNAAATLSRDNVLWVILSAVTTSARSRRILNGLDWERAAEARLIDTVDAIILSRHGGEVALSNAVDVPFWNWFLEDNPLAESSLSGLPVVSARRTIVFNPPSAFTSTMKANAITQARADLY